MTIKVITEENDIKAYYNLLTKAITDEPQFFRVSAVDILGEVFPTKDTFENFTLGAFSEEGELYSQIINQPTTLWTGRYYIEEYVKRKCWMKMNYNFWKAYTQ